MSRFNNRADAVEHAIGLMSRGHYSVFVRNDDEAGDFDVYPAGSELAPDGVGWTYNTGTQFPEAATDHSRLFEPCESLDTLAQFIWHMPALEEWINSNSTSDVSLEWSPVEDFDLRFCEECGTFHDSEGETTADNLVGHVYLMRVWE